MSRGKALHRSGGGRRGRPREAAKANDRDRGLRHTLESLSAFGLHSLGRRLAWLSGWSFFAGLTQAGVLIILSDVAVGAARGNNKQIHLGVVDTSVDRALWIAFGLLIGCFVGGTLAAVASSSTAAEVLLRGRDKVLNAFFGSSWNVQSQERLGQVQQLLTVHSERLGLIVMALAIGLQALLSVLALLLAAFIVSPVAAIGVLVVGALLFLLLRPINAMTRRAARHMVNDGQNMATMATEYTRLSREFRLLGVESEAVEHIAEANATAAQSFRRTRFFSQVVPTSYQSLALLFVLVGMWVLAQHGGKNLASIAAVLLLVLRSLTYGAQIQGTSQQFREYGAFIDDLRTQLTFYEDAPQEQVGSEIPEIFDIRCENVGYAYDGVNLVLNNVSFYAAAGELVGVVGRSGSGKTTLSQLVLGMRNPLVGSLTVGGVAPSSLAHHDGLSVVALVAQEPILLRGSIAYNVALFRDVSPDEVEAACRAAHLHDEILAMAQGYETPVGEGGGALSGGQRQRLSIARALIGNPRLLVLDEPTSALDGRSEQLIRQTLQELRGKMTMVVISHRLATVDICDTLLVFERGHLIDAGPGPQVRSGKAFRHVVEASVGEL